MQQLKSIPYSQSSCEYLNEEYEKLKSIRSLYSNYDKLYSTSNQRPFKQMCQVIDDFLVAIKKSPDYIKQPVTLLRTLQTTNNYLLNPHDKQAETLFMSLSRELSRANPAVEFANMMTLISAMLTGCFLSLFFIYPTQSMPAKYALSAAISISAAVSVGGVISQAKAASNNDITKAMKRMNQINKPVFFVSTLRSTHHAKTKNDSSFKSEPAIRLTK